MNHKIIVLMIRALRGSGKAYRKLGLMFARGNKEERVLSRLCFEESMKRGDEYSFFIYHKHFSKDCQVIDDSSYREMLNEYMSTSDLVKRKKLRRYLELGTRRQRITLLPDGNMADAGMAGRIKKIRRKNVDRNTKLRYNLKYIERKVQG